MNPEDSAATAFGKELVEISDKLGRLSGDVKAGFKETNANVCHLRGDVGELKAERIPIRMAVAELDITALKGGQAALEKRVDEMSNADRKPTDSGPSTAIEAANVVAKSALANPSLYLLILFGLVCGASAVAAVWYLTR